MMQTPTNRNELHDILVEILGSNHVYFDPPEKFKMAYPAIVYYKNPVKSTFADDKPYKHTHGYTVTLIDEDPDSEIFDKMIELPMCIHDNHFTSNGMNHDVFIINF